MAFDLKKTIEDVTSKIKNDPKTLDNFKKDPEKTIEGLIGIDIPDGQLDGIIAGVKAKITADKVGGMLGGLKDMMKK